MTLITNRPPMNVARFSGFFIQTVFTGVYWVHFYFYIQTIRQRSNDRQINLFRTPMFVVGCLLFFVVNGEFIVFAISAFLALENCVTTDSPIDERGFLSLGPGWNFAYNAFYIATPVVADGFLIYRLFIVWSRNWWITVIPIGFSMALIVTASLAARYFVASVKTIFDGSRRWMVAAFSLTFACNVYCTSLIALRVVLTQHRIKSRNQVPRTNLQKCIEVLIKSAALYCILVGLSFVFSVVESNALYMSVAATSPVVGICFCMIVTRVDRDHISHSTSGGGTMTQQPLVPLPHVVRTNIIPSPPSDADIAPGTSISSAMNTPEETSSSSSRSDDHGVRKEGTKVVSDVEAASGSTTNFRVGMVNRPVNFPETQIGLARRMRSSEAVTCLVEQVTEISGAS